VSSNYGEDVSIDKFDLAVECEHHAALYLEWSEKYACATDERDGRKDQLDLVRAELSSEVRASPDLLGEGVKVTEGSISEYVLKHPKFREAYDRYLKAKKNAMVLGAAKDAFEHRRSMLESLVKLWLGGYFAELRVSGEAKEKLGDEVKKEHLEKLQGNKRLKGRRRKK